MQYVESISVFQLHDVIFLAELCNPTCQQGGTCVAGRCVCPEQFTGVDCSGICSIKLR